MKNSESNESIKFVSFGEVTRKLGQSQYISRFVNPNERIRGTRPYFSEIRIEGDPDDYHSLKIHPDDIRSFIEQWFEYEKSFGDPYFTNKKLEDFL